MFEQIVNSLTKRHKEVNRRPLRSVPQNSYNKVPRRPTRIYRQALLRSYRNSEPLPVGLDNSILGRDKRGLHNRNNDFLS